MRGVVARLVVLAMLATGAVAAFTTSTLPTTITTDAVGTSGSCWGAAGGKVQSVFTAITGDTPPKAYTVIVQLGTATDGTAGKSCIMGYDASNTGLTVLAHGSTALIANKFLSGGVALGNNAVYVFGSTNVGGGATYPFTTTTFGQQTLIANGGFAETISGSPALLFKTLDGGGTLANNVLVDRNTCHLWVMTTAGPFFERVKTNYAQKCADAAANLPSAVGPAVAVTATMHFGKLFRAAMRVNNGDTEVYFAVASSQLLYMLRIVGGRLGPTTPTIQAITAQYAGGMTFIPTAYSTLSHGMFVSQQGAIPTMLMQNAVWGSAFTGISSPDVENSLRSFVAVEGSPVGTFTLFAVRVLTLDQQANGDSPFEDDTERALFLHGSSARIATFAAVTVALAVDECLEGTHSCNPTTHTCDNTPPGSFTCTASATDPCDTNNGGCGSTAACTSANNVVTCMCPAGTAGNPPTTPCSGCPAGTYAPAGSASCLGCGDGKTSPANSDTADDCVCAIGAGTDGLGGCEQCHDNTYKGTAGNGPCTACTDYSVAPDGATSAAQCLCNAGYEHSGDGTCAACNYGAFKAGAGNTGVCAPCDPGYGSELSAASAACVACTTGEALVEGQCVACNSGKFASAAGATDGCSSCGAGTYAGTDAAGYDECDRCAAGKFSGIEGASECIDCAFGTRGVEGGSSFGACACGAGTVPTTEERVLWNGATYSNGEGMTSSSVASANIAVADGQGGTTTTSIASGTLTPANTLQISSFSGCWRQASSLLARPTVVAPTGVCLNPTYVLSPGVDPVGYNAELVAAFRVTATSYASIGSETLRLIVEHLDGAVTQFGVDQIVPFGEGTFLFTTSVPIDKSLVRAVVLSMPTGDTHLYVSEVIAVVHKGTSGVSNLQCTDCAAGTAATTSGLYSCAACAAGTFSASVGASECSACTGATYSTSSGSSACDPCPSRAAWEGGTTHDTRSGCVCTLGTFLAATGASECTDCVAGRYGAAGGACDGCAVGRFSTAAGASSGGACEGCATGRYASFTGASACASCPEGTTSPLGSTSVAACACVAGKKSTREYVYYGRWDAQISTEFYLTEYSAPGLNIDQVEFTVSPNNAVARVKAYTDMPATNQNKFAEFYFSNVIAGSNVVAAPLDSSKAAKTLEFLINPYNGQTITTRASRDPTPGQCAACPPGTYGAGGPLATAACIPCAIGFYSATPGATASEACTACPSGATTAVEGSSECVCKPGYYPLDDGTGSCAPYLVCGGTDLAARLVCPVTHACCAAGSTATPCNNANGVDAVCVSTQSSPPSDDSVSFALPSPGGGSTLSIFGTVGATIESSSSLVILGDSQRAPGATPRVIEVTAAGAGTPIQQAVISLCLLESSADLVIDLNNNVLADVDCNSATPAALWTKPADARCKDPAALTFKNANGGKRCEQPLLQQGSGVTSVKFESSSFAWSETLDTTGLRSLEIVDSMITGVVSVT